MALTVIGGVSQWGVVGCSGSRKPLFYKYFVWYRLNLPDTTSFFSALFCKFYPQGALILTFHIKGTWRPSVELVGAAPTVPAPLGATYTKTSLALKPQPQVRHLKGECQKIKLFQINFSSLRPKSHVWKIKGECPKIKTLQNSLLSVDLMAQVT